MNVNRETAEKEINQWLDFKRVSRKKREENEEAIEQLVEAIMDGVLSFSSEDHTLVHTLQVPIENSEGTVVQKEFTYKPRIKVSDIHREMKGIKASDMDARVSAYLSAITGESRNVLIQMDTVDYAISQQLVVFFI